MVVFFSPRISFNQFSVYFYRVVCIFSIISFVFLRIHAEPLQELAITLNSLSNLSFKGSERYLLSDYLKSKDNFAERVCHDSSQEPEVHRDVSAYQNLLGSGLKFKDLGITDKTLSRANFEYNFMGDFTPWSFTIPVATGKVGDFSVLVDCDPHLKIYQLRVLTQKKSDCSLHAVKNLLWLMAALKFNRYSFSSYYSKMLSPWVYSKFLNSAGCPLDPPEAYRHVLDVYTKTNQHGSFPGLPNESDTYIHNFVELAAFSPTARNIGSIPKGKKAIKMYGVQEDLARIKLAISSIEPELNEQEIESTMNIIIILLGSDKFKYPIELLPDVFDAVHSSESYLLGIYLLVSTGAPAHATSLIINKYHNNIEYLFTDPLNWPFTRRGNYFHGYKTALKTIASFVDTPIILKEAMVRYLYSNVLYNLEVKKAIYQMLHSKVYKTALYREKYKIPFCNLIKSRVNQEVTQEAYLKLCEE